MEVKYRRADELDCGDVIISDGMETVVESVEVVSGYIRINKKEVLTPPEAQLRIVCRAPSDLEIVQKALEETGFELEYFSSGNWWIHSTGTIGQVVRTGTGSQSLLTWAKQTIGVE